MGDWLWTHQRGREGPERQRDARVDVGATRREATMTTWPRRRGCGRGNPAGPPAFRGQSPGASSPSPSALGQSPSWGQALARRSMTLPGAPATQVWPLGCEQGRRVACESLCVQMKGAPSGTWTQWPQIRPPPSCPDLRVEGPSQGRGVDSWQPPWGPCQLPHSHSHPGPQMGLCACVCEQSRGPEDTVTWALITAGWDSPPTRLNMRISLVIRTSDNPPTSERELLFLSLVIDGTDIKAAKDR